MQLKRDTDYALRILYCLSTNPSYENSFNSGLTISEIARRTNLQKLIVKRLCDLLEPLGFINISVTETYPLFSASEGLGSHSLLDVIEGVEGRTTLFAVFSHDSLLFEQCRKKLQRTEAKFQSSLKRILLSDLFSPN